MSPVGRVLALAATAAVAFGIMGALASALA